MPNIILVTQSSSQIPWLAKGQEFAISQEVEGTGLPREFQLETGVNFRKLVQQWRAERGASSSMTEMLLCPSYQRIIGMGPVVVPAILAQMKSEGDDPDHWSWALQILTGVNPVAEEDEGDLQAMANSWLSWAASCRSW